MHHTGNYTCEASNQYMRFAAKKLSGSILVTVTCKHLLLTRLFSHVYPLKKVITLHVMTISFTTTKTAKEKGTCKTRNKQVQGFVGFTRQPSKTQQGKGPVLSTPVINIHWILQYLFHFKEFWVIGESCISFLEGREVGGGGRGSKRRQRPSGEVVDCHASLNQRRRLGARVNHLENISGNSIWKVDVIRLFGSFQ